jgi:hypothetical protein
MSCSANGTAEIVSKIDYSLGSDWVTVPSAAATYGFHDDSSGGKSLLTKSETPAPAPLGTTSMLVGLQGGSGLYGIQAIPLQDAPEGGTWCVQCLRALSLSLSLSLVCLLGRLLVSARKFLLLTLRPLLRNSHP